MRVFKGHLIAYKESDKDLRYITEDEESLFYRVPKQILSYIDGCPSKITYVELSYNDEIERLVICATDIASDKERFTVSIQIDRIFRYIEAEGFPKETLVD